MIFERWWRRAAVCLAAASALSLAGLRPARAVSSTVVISQAYGGGGNAGATLKNDFVELYNLGSTPVDVTGWTIQYTNATGTFKATLSATDSTVLSGTIQPGHYFLVQEAAGAAGTVSLPTPDVTGSIAMSGTNFKVALVSDSVALGATTCPSSASIVDFLGVGTANCFETTVAAAVTNTTSALRAGSPRGTVDTDNNSADFTTGAPDPRNSAYVGAPSVTSATFAPASVDPGQTSLLAVGVAAGFSPVASVTADLTQVGGSATQALTLNGATGKYEFNVVVPLNAVGGSRIINITATDTASRTATATAVLSVNGAAPLTVGEARQQPQNATFTLRGIVTDITSGNAYVQDADSVTNGGGVTLFDGSTVTGTSIDTTDLQLGQDITFTATLGTYANELELINLNGISINAASVPLPAVKTVTVPQVTGNDTYEGQLVRITNLTVVSAPSTTTVTSTAGSGIFVAADDAGNQIAVYIHKNTGAYANTPYPGVPANPIPASLDGTTNVISWPDVKVGDIYTVAGPLAERNPPSGGGPVKMIRVRDANDLVKTGVGLISATSATPTVVARGMSTTLSVTTSVASGPVVTVDLTPIGGSAAQAFTGDGAGNYTLDVPISGGAPLGPAKLNVTATNGTNVGHAVISITVVTPVVEVTSIAQARAAADYTQVHITTGVATSVGTTGAGQSYIQDATGGLYLFNNASPLAVNIGDPIDATGFKLTFSGSVEVDWSYTGASAFSTGNGTALTPATVATSGWPNKAGQLVVNNNLFVISGTATTGTGSFTVSDGTSVGQLFVHTNAKLTTYPVAGSTYSVTGIADYYKTTTTDAWQLKVRSQSDLVLTGAAPAAVPAKLAFSTEPVGGMPGSAFGTQPVVTVQTAGGTTASAYTGPVNLVIKSGTGAAGAVLSGATTVNAVNGVATFSGLSIDLAGTGYVLTATSTGVGTSLLTAADSAAFNIGQTVLYGDIDKSGAVDANDAILGLKVYAGLVAGNDPSVSVVNGDVYPKGTPDGTISLGDVLRIIRSVNALDTLP